MVLQDLRVDRQRMADICRQYRVAKLEAFGSFARGDADPGSDLDILVTFLPDAGPGLELVALHEELVSLFGRRVDLLTRSSVERSPNKYFRRFALRKTEPVYEQP